MKTTALVAATAAALAGLASPVSAAGDCEGEFWRSQPEEENKSNAFWSVSAAVQRAMPTQHVWVIVGTLRRSIEHGTLAAIVGRCLYF